MSKSIDRTKKAEVSVLVAEFEMPPMKDALIIGKQAPVGTEAAKRMADLLCPDQYEVIKLEHETIEAIVIRKALLSMLPKDTLLDIILAEGGKAANEVSLLKIQLSVKLHVTKAVELC